MKWLKPNEVTEPGDYLYGSLQVPKSKPMPTKFVHRETAGRSLFLVDSLGWEFLQDKLDSDLRFFGPIPPME